MAIWKWTEYWNDTAGDDDSPGREYTRHFKAHTDDILDSPKVALDYAECPQVHDVYVDTRSLDLGGEPFTDTGALAVKRHAERASDTPYIFMVDIEYSTRYGDPEKQIEDPTERPPTRDWSGASEEIALIQDVDGRPIVNSAGEFLEPPQTDELGSAVVTITKFINDGDFNPVTYVSYQGATNSDTFLGFDPGTCKFKSWKAPPHFENGISCRQLTVEIHIREQGWARYLLDQGYQARKLDVDDDTLSQIVDGFGATPSGPTLLNGEGRKLTDAFAILGTSISDTDTEMDLGIGADLAIRFPAAPFWVKMGNEYINVTDFNPGTGIATIVRGGRGSDAAAHTAPKTMQMQPYYLTFVTKKSLPFADLGLE